MIDLLFPFNDELLKDYKRKSITSEDRKRFAVTSIFFVGISLFFSFIGTDAHYAKLILFSPVFLLNILAGFLYIFSHKERNVLLGAMFSILSMSSFAMALVLDLGMKKDTIQEACSQMKLAIPIYLVFLVIGYRVHFHYQLKHGGTFKKIEWNSVSSTIIILLGISLAKIISRSAIVFILWIVWFALHMMISSIVLECKKYCRSEE